MTSNAETPVSASTKRSIVLLNQQPAPVQLKILLKFKHETCFYFTSPSILLMFKKKKKKKKLRHGIKGIGDFARIAATRRSWGGGRAWCWCVSQCVSVCFSHHTHLPHRHTHTNTHFKIIVLLCQRLNERNVEETALSFTTISVSNSQKSTPLKGVYTTIVILSRTHTDVTHYWGNTPRFPKLILANRRSAFFIRSRRARALGDETSRKCFRRISTKKHWRENEKRNNPMKKLVPTLGSCDFKRKGLHDGVTPHVDPISFKEKQSERKD